MLHAYTARLDVGVKGSPFDGGLAMTAAIYQVLQLTAIMQETPHDLPF